LTNKLVYFEKDALYGYSCYRSRIMPKLSNGGTSMSLSDRTTNFKVTL